MTKYKGRNIRVNTDVHDMAVKHIGKMKKLGAWTDEAILEKIKKESKKKDTQT